MSGKLEGTQFLQKTKTTVEQFKERFSNQEAHLPTHRVPSREHFFSRYIQESIGLAGAV